MAETGKVEISRGTLTALVGTLAGALLVLVFVAGRMSAPTTVVAAAPSPVVAAPVATPVALAVEPVATNSLDTERVATPPPPLPATIDPPTEPAAVASPVSAAVVTTPTMPASSGVPTGTAPPRRSHDVTGQIHGEPASAASVAKSSDPALRLAVSQYFVQVDATMAGTGDLGDMNQFATGLLSQGAQGDASGFDDLLAKARAAETKLAAIHPPAPCKEHHAMAVAQLHSMVGLLGQVKKATMTMDTSAFTSLAAQGQQMQSQVNRLQELTTQLKHRYAN